MFKTKSFNERIRRTRNYALKYNLCISVFFDIAQVANFSRGVSRDLYIFRSSLGKV